MKENIMGFVILHYQAINETIDCVNSIKRILHNQNYKIVIVDNCSPNKSGHKLKQMYGNDQNVYCLLNHKNLGFANGNNIGYQFAKNHLNCDFICCLNNDTLMIDRYFIDKIEREYRYSSFDILAPLVYLKNNTIQGFHPYIREISFYQKELKKWEQAEDLSIMKDTLTSKQLVLSKLGKIGLYIKILKQHVFRDYLSRKENVVLHGCCLIFSPKYIQIFDTAFDDRTFMFREEELLYLRLLKYGLKSVYNPKIKIKHLEDASTNQAYTNNREKFLFYQKSQINSLKTLIEELSQNGIN